MHRVEVRKDQDALALPRAPLGRGLRFQDVAESVAARRAIEVEAEVAELALDTLLAVADPSAEVF